MRCFIAIGLRGLALATAAIAGCGEPSSDPSSDASSSGNDSGTTDSGETSDGPIATRQVYAGTLDGNGDAVVAVAALDLDDMPLIQGWVFTSSFAEPAFAQIGNLIPQSGTFRFDTSPANAGATYVLVVDPSQTREVWHGVLGDDGDAVLDIPEIDVDQMPLAQGWVFTSAFAEPAYAQLGNLIPGAGTFRFDTSASYAGADYILVVDVRAGAVRRSGTLDATGDATLDVAEIVVDDMPLIQGWVHTDSFAEPAYAQIGNLVPASGTFRFAAGTGNGSSDYRLVVSP